MSLSHDELVEELVSTIEICHALIAELESYDEATALLIADTAGRHQPITLIGDLERGTAKRQRQSGAMMIDVARIERILQDLERSLLTHERRQPRHNCWPEFLK